MIGGRSRAKGILAAILSWFSISAPAQADAVMTAEEFTRSYAVRVERLFPGAKVTIKQTLEVEIELGPDSEQAPFKAYLDNAFRRYLAEPARIEEVLNEHARAFSGDFDEASFARREQLVAVVRHKDYMDEMTRTKRSDQVFPGHQLAGDIYVFYAFDAPDTLRFADIKTIEEAGLKEADFGVVAIQNLRRIMAEPLLETYAEMVTVSANDPYMTSALLIDEFWTVDRFRFRGDPVVFVVGRDLMLVTGSEENSGLEAAGKATQELIGQVPYPISAMPIVRRNGKWQSFVQ